MSDRYPYVALATGIGLKSKLRAVRVSQASIVVEELRTDALGSASWVRVGSLDKDNINLPADLVYALILHGDRPL